MGEFRNGLWLEKLGLKIVSVAFAIMVSICIIAPLRIFLIGTSVSFLKNQVCLQKFTKALNFVQKVIGSRTMQLKKRVINVLFQQVF